MSNISMNKRSQRRAVCSSTPTYRSRRLPSPAVFMTASIFPRSLKRKKALSHPNTETPILTFTSRPCNNCVHNKTKKAPSNFENLHPLSPLSYTPYVRMIMTMKSHYFPQFGQNLFFSGLKCRGLKSCLHTHISPQQRAVRAFSPILQVGTFFGAWGLSGPCCFETFLRSDP